MMASRLARAGSIHPSRIFTAQLSTPRCNHDRLSLLSGMAYLYSSSLSSASHASTSKLVAKDPVLPDQPPVIAPEKPAIAPGMSADAASPQIAARPPGPPKAERPKPRLRAQKAAISLTSGAVDRLKGLLKGPTPQLIRVGVRNKGCAGMSYHLEYVEKSGPFDEVVEQDGVKVLIDSKALFSIIGSEMDWKEDRLSSKFVFKNPNVKDACGCGESFTV